MSGWSGYSEKGQGSEERGPGTFSFALPGSPRVQYENATPLQMGYQRAGDTTGTYKYDKPVDPTLTAVAEFAKSVMAPKLAELRGQKFLEGVQRAASGEALTQIVNERPWYANIFGEGAVVEGARAYTTQANAARLAAQLEERMPELRTMSPDAIPGVIMEATKALQSGDAKADAAVGAQALKLLPSVISRHTREHYKYLQEEAVKSHTNALQAAASSLNVAASAADMYSPEELEQRRDILFDTMRLAPGMNAQSWESTIQTFIASTAESGQFHALNSIMDAGVVAALPPDKRLVLEKQLNTYRAQHARQALEGYSDKIAEIRYNATSGAISGEQVFAAYDAINEDYQKRTGNTLPVVGKAEKVGTAMTAMQALLARDKQIATAALKAQSAEEQAQAVHALVMTSGTAAAKAAGVKAQDAEDAFMAEYRKKQGDPLAQAKLLLHDAQSGGKVDAVATDITRMLSGQTDTLNDNFVQAYALWRNLDQMHPVRPGESNPAIDTYYGKKQAAQMRAFHNALNGRSIEEAGEQAFVAASKVLVDPAYSWGPKQLPKVREYIDKHVRGNAFLASDSAKLSGNQAAYFGAPAPLYGSSQRTIEAMMANEFGALGPHVSEDQGIAESLGRARANGLEVFGQHAWVIGQGRPKLEQRLQYRAGEVPADKVEIAAAVNGVADARIKAITDKTPDDVQLIRVQDAPDGDPQFQMFVRVGGEFLPPTTFNGADLLEHIRLAREEKPKANERKARAEDAVKNDETLNRVFSPKRQPFAKGGFVPLR